MPDDPRRSVRPEHSPEVEPESALDDSFDEGLDDLDMTPEQLAEIERAQLDEMVERARAIDEGREVCIPWEEVRESLFAPPTPEELAALPPRRARR